MAAICLIEFTYRLPIRRIPSIAVNCTGENE
jgi:hypothetical protein